MYEQEETMAYSPEMDNTQAAEQASPLEAPSAEGADGDGLGDSLECNRDDKAESLEKPCDEPKSPGCGESGNNEATEMGADAPDPADPPQSPDPAPQALDTNQTADSELECIRRELSLLRTQLEEQSRAMRKIGTEYAEFCDLYPNLSPEELPDEVWENVRRGVPLSAAYALAERRRIRTLEKAQSLNEENKRRSSGSVEGNPNHYFSADEVRAMTQSEVRANYQKIMLSMPKWR